MSVLHELAEGFGMSEREMCIRAGYSPLYVKRILEADTIIYPGEFQKLMRSLRVMSLKTRDYEMQSATIGHQWRLECLEKIAEKCGMDIRPCEDPHVF